MHREKKNLSDFESVGWGFESLRVRHTKASKTEAFSSFGWASPQGGDVIRIAPGAP